MRERFPDRYPVVVDRKDSSIADIGKRKFMVPGSLECGQLTYIIRKRLRLAPGEALFVFLRHTGALVDPAERIDAAFARCVALDGFLYITYAMENTFGSWRPRLCAAPYGTRSCPS